MKRVQVSETDQVYRTGLVEMMLARGAIPVVYEVPDNFDMDCLHGLEEFKEKAAQPVLSATYPEVAAWLENYKGTFEFYLSLKHQFEAKGMLSEKQIACVQKAIASDKARGIQVGTLAPKVFTLKVGEVLLLSKGISNKISQQAGYDRGHRVVEVIDVEGETEKAYRARIRLSARRTSHCGVCGLMLENPVSVAAGIGPICADKTGLSFGESSLRELELKLSTTVEVTTWIPKSSIKQRVEK